MSDHKPERENGRETPPPPDKSRTNTAPDAVKDPNEKTKGYPGVPPKSRDDQVDPGAG